MPQVTRALQQHKGWGRAVKPARKARAGQRSVTRLCSRMEQSRVMAARGVCTQRLGWNHPAHQAYAPAGAPRQSHEILKLLTVRDRKLKTRLPETGIEKYINVHTDTQNCDWSFACYCNDLGSSPKRRAWNQRTTRARRDPQGPSPMTPKSHHGLKPQHPSEPCRQPLPLKILTAFLFSWYHLKPKNAIKSSKYCVVNSQHNRSCAHTQDVPEILTFFIILMHSVPCVLSLVFPSKM